MKLENEFKCRHLRGDGRCKLKQCICNRGHCVHYFDCTECEFRLFTESQEPCERCYFASKSKMLEYIRKYTK